MKNKQLLYTALLIGCIFVFCGCNNQNKEEVSEINNDSPTHVASIRKKRGVIDKTALVDVENLRKTVNKIVHDNVGENVKLTTFYLTNQTKSSQEDIDFTINKLDLTEIVSNNTSANIPYRTILSLCYTLKNNSLKEINIYPKEAVLILDNGDKIQGDDFIDYWEDVFTKGKRKNGSFHFKLTNKNLVETVNALKIVFTGYVTENQKTTFEKEFTFEAPLDLMN